MPIRAKTSWLLQISNSESRISAAVSSPSSAGTFGRGEVTIPLSTDAILKRPSARALAWAGDPKLRWSTPSDTSSCRSKDQSVECAVPSPLAGNAVNPSMEAPRRHPCRRGSRNRQGHRTRKLVGCFLKIVTRPAIANATFVYCVLKARLLLGLRRENGESLIEHLVLQATYGMLCLQTCTPTIFDGPCPPTVAGPYAAWMPRKSLQGRTCGVSREGGRARALQKTLRSAALHPMRA